MNVSSACHFPSQPGVALRGKVKLFEFVFTLQPLESVHGKKTQKNDGKEHIACTIKY